MKKFLIIFFFLNCTVILAQGEANYWYFGNHAGLDFSTTPPTALTDGQLSTLEGCTTISDSNGNLLFYTDGSIVYDKTHQVMLNGTDLKGDESSTSSALIVPKPGVTNIYYVFTVDEPHHSNVDSDPNNNNGDGENNGLMYSLVDMTLNNGKGAVIQTQKNLPLITYNPSNSEESAYKCSEKITAVISDNCSSFWIVTHFIDSFYAFEVSESGINETPVISTVGVTVPLSGYRRNSLGYMKVSPQGDQLAVAHLGLGTVTGGNGPGKVLLYDFDNATGVVSNENELYNGDSPYGIEFSSSGNRLYASINLGDDGSGDGFIVQYDLTVPENQIAASEYIIPNENGDLYTIYNAGALQLAPDGRIYRALFSFNSTQNDYLGVIKNPEVLGADLQYTETEMLVDVDGNRSSTIGLPPFIQSLFSTYIDIVNISESVETELFLCDGETFTLQGDVYEGATYTWYKNDELLEDETSFQLEISQPENVELPYSENYKLEIDKNDGTCPLLGLADITYFSNPEINTDPEDETVCNDDPEGNAVYDLSEKRTELLENEDENFLNILFFGTEESAEQRIDALPDLYEITTDEQEIFVRYENSGNSNCFVLKTFTLFASEAPVIAVDSAIVVCENPNSVPVVFDLSEYAHSILENDDPFVFEKSFYHSFADAENETDAISLPFEYALDPDETSIFFRFKNLNNPLCYDIFEIPILINPLPEAFDSELTQCFLDQAGPNSLFNLLLAEENITDDAENVEVAYFTTFSNAENGINGIENPEAFPNVTNPQTIFAKVKNPETGCFRIAELLLTLNMTEANDAQLIACDNDTDGFFQFNLNDANEQILLDQPADLTIQYFETEENALLEISPLSNNFSNTVPFEQMIYARVESGDLECFGISEVELIVNTIPNLPEDEELIYCLDQFPNTITLSAGINQNSETYSFSWTNGETSAEIEINEPGNYAVTVTNISSGCENTRNILVVPSNSAVIEDIIIEGIEFNNSVSVLLSSENNGNYEFSLDNIYGPYQAENYFENVGPGLHTVYVRDLLGCGITPANFSVVGFPKFFTPNNDGYNDYWQVTGVDETHEADAQIFIFDRYGKLMQQLNPNSEGWNGSYNGHPMPVTDYWYRVILEDGREYRGHFSLKR
ncbi:MAG TPA: T9SS type B sorting domain-containing protein [Salinimicrobium sp.]|nr:T9SS type B sorting domain-containing protein [Salinimicrobium sp.]